MLHQNIKFVEKILLQDKLVLHGSLNRTIPEIIEYRPLCEIIYETCFALPHELIYVKIV